MKSTDVIGYTFNADCFCDACGSTLPDTDSEGNEKHPIFPDMEVDCPWHCAECHAMIDCALTSDGIEYVLAALREDLVTGRTSDTGREWASAIRFGTSLASEEQTIADLYLDRCDYVAAHSTPGVSP